MKIKHVITTLALAGLMGAGAFAGIKSSASIRETKALTAEDYIYLDNTSFFDNKERYAAYFFTDGGGSEWIDFTWDASIGFNKVERLAYDKVVLCRMNGGTTENNWDNRWAQTGNLDNHTGIYKPYSKDGGATPVNGSWRYPLTVGSTVSYMIPHGTAEVKSTVDAKVNDAVSLKEDQDTPAGVLYPQAKASNNMTADCHIKTTSSTTIYVARSGWSTFASGYAPESTKLQDFCDALMALDCDSKNLPTTEWNALSNSEKSSFRDATAIPGYGKTAEDYKSVLVESKTRYELLVAKGATPLEMPALNSAPMAITKNNNYIPVIIIVSSITLVALLAAGVMIKRRKEDR